jgi:hypothetical protein
MEGIEEVRRFIVHTSFIDRESKGTKNKTEGKA